MKVVRVLIYEADPDEMTAHLKNCGVPLIGTKRTPHMTFTSWVDIAVLESLGLTMDDATAQGWIASMPVSEAP